MTDKARELLERDCFEYAPEIGGTCIRWKVDAYKKRTKGKMAGSPSQKGYWQIYVHGKKYYAHRVVFLLVHGRWPEGQIDHINGDRSDNRIENLRECSVSENHENRGISNKNTSGFVGVSKCSDRNLWQAKINKNRKTYHLGRFDTPEEAHLAYVKAKAEFHEFNPEKVNRPAYEG